MNLTNTQKDGLVGWYKQTRGIWLQPESQQALSSLNGFFAAITALDRNNPRAAKLIDEALRELIPLLESLRTQQGEYEKIVPPQKVPRTLGLAA